MLQTPSVQGGEAPFLDRPVIRQRIDDFAAKRATTARALKPQDRKLLIQQLRQDGLLNVRKSMDTVAQHLGVSRATAYLYARQSVQAGE